MPLFGLQVNFSLKLSIFSLLEKEMALLAVASGTCVAMRLFLYNNTLDYYYYVDDINSSFFIFYLFFVFPLIILRYVCRLLLRDQGKTNK